MKKQNIILSVLALALIIVGVRAFTQKADVIDNTVYVEDDNLGAITGPEASGPYSCVGNFCKYAVAVPFTSLSSSTIFEISAPVGSSTINQVVCQTAATSGSAYIPIIMKQSNAGGTGTILYQGPSQPANAAGTFKGLFGTSTSEVALSAYNFSNAASTTPGHNNINDLLTIRVTGNPAGSSVQADWELTGTCRAEFLIY